MTTSTNDSGRKGADILLDVLESEGCEYVFGNPGTTELPLIDALVDRPGLNYVLGLQEASVVAMADGYAQASGKPGFVNLHTAGGLGHGLPGRERVGRVVRGRGGEDGLAEVLGTDLVDHLLRQHAVSAQERVERTRLQRVPKDRDAT